MINFSAASGLTRRLALMRTELDDLVTSGQSLLKLHSSIDSLGDTLTEGVNELTFSFDYSQAPSDATFCRVTCTIAQQIIADRTSATGLISFERTVFASSEFASITADDGFFLPNIVYNASLNTPSLVYQFFVNSSYFASPTDLSVTLIITGSTGKVSAISSNSAVNFTLEFFGGTSPV